MANMGTNLSQVLIANVSNLDNGSNFTDLATTAGAEECGVWDVNGGAYLATKLWEANVDFTASDSATDEGAADLITKAHPNWLYSRLQFVQGAKGQNIATPLIDTRLIRSVRFDPFEQTVGHKVTLGGTAAGTDDVTVKFVIRTTPLAQLNFHDPDGTGYIDIDGDGKDFPLGAFNTTNHKAISVEIVAADYSNLNTLCDKLADAVQAHSLLNNIIKVSGSNEEIYSARHAGVIFDLVITDGDGEKITSITQTVAGAVNGVGNDWQVLSEEIRCRSRQGNFNRMYLPQNLATYTKSGNAYHKLTISYEHGWPTSTGIAPAGTLNQVVLYVGADGTADTAGDTNIDTIFGISDMTAAQEFVW